MLLVDEVSPEPESGNQNHVISNLNSPWFRVLLDSFNYKWCSRLTSDLCVAGPAVDQEAERDVQPVRLADAASRPSGGADHRQHHGPAGADHDQQSRQPAGEERRRVSVTRSLTSFLLKKKNFILKVARELPVMMRVCMLCL